MLASYLLSNYLTIYNHLNRYNEKIVINSIVFFLGDYNFTKSFGVLAVEFEILVKDGLTLVSRVKQEIRFIRSCNYTQASLDILHTASFNLDSAEDLLNYANELALKNDNVAGEKVLIASNAIKKVQSMLSRQFDAELDCESQPWFENVAANIGICA